MRIGANNNMRGGTIYDMTAQHTTGERREGYGRDSKSVVKRSTSQQSRMYHHNIMTSQPSPTPPTPSLRRHPSILLLLLLTPLHHPQRLTVGHRCQLIELLMRFSEEVDEEGTG